MSRTPGNGEQLALLLNLQIGQVYNLANSGTIPKSNGGDWDIMACAHAYIKYLQGRAGEEKRDYAMERTRLTRHQADKAEMEVQVMAGQLLRAEIVEQVWTAMIMAFRAKILAIPSRLAAPISACQSTRETELLIRDVIEEAMIELAAYDVSQYTPKIIDKSIGQDGDQVQPSEAKGDNDEADRPKRKRRSPNKNLRADMSTHS